MMVRSHSVSPLSEQKRTNDITLMSAKIKTVHDSYSYNSGVAKFIKLHLQLRSKITLLDANEISREADLAPVETYPGAEIIIQQDTGAIDTPLKLA